MAKTAVLNKKSPKEVFSELAHLSERALIEEVTLSPKPGLVDTLTNGSHTDMDYHLFIRSAKSLTPYFAEMAEAAWGSAIDQGLREEIAMIGREAEAAMFAATNGVNTHKGAIWTMGLLISVVSQHLSQYNEIQLEHFFEDIERLVSFADNSYQKDTETHGDVVKKKFGKGGAFLEASQGFPHIQIALDEYYQCPTTEKKTDKQLRMLLRLMTTLDDTCILYRKDETVLRQFQYLAKAANQPSLKNKAFDTLIAFCEEENISPGGSADLLAGAIFMIAVSDEEATIL